LSNNADDNNYAKADADADDADFLAVLERIAARPRPTLTQGTALLTPWGVPARLTDVYEGFAKSPVDIVNGVIVTPMTMLYRLVMDSQATAQCPVRAERGLDLGNGKAILDLPITEVEAWSKA
jgi:hypothetical protein